MPTIRSEVEHWEDYYTSGEAAKDQAEWQANLPDTGEIENPLFCQRCNSPRVAHLSAKSSDLNFVILGDAEHYGYVPEDMGIGSDDYVELAWCLDCGQIQGFWPLPKTNLEK